MGFWKEVKKQWSRDNKDLTKEEFLCIFVAAFSGNILTDIASDYFHIIDSNFLVHLLVFFVAFNIGYIPCKTIINQIKKWKEKN